MEQKMRFGLVGNAALIEILLRLSTAKYWSESLLISVRIAVLDISNDQKKL